MANVAYALGDESAIGKFKRFGVEQDQHHGDGQAAAAQIAQ